MVELDQFQITQEIVDRLLQGVTPGWRELIVDYHDEDIQSDCGATYLFDEDGILKERAVPIARDMDTWFRMLRGHLAAGGKQEYTSCRLHLFADGRFESSYGYDAVDWAALFRKDWNFFPKETCGVMRVPENEILVLDIAGNCARLNCLKKGAEPILTRLGFTKNDAQMVRAILDVAEREELVRVLIEMGALFSGGPGWSPSELVARYREQGIIKTGYKSINWKTPEQYIIIDH